MIAYQPIEMKHGTFSANVGSPVATRKEAEQICGEAARDHWERCHQITPTTTYTVGEVVSSRVL